MQRPNLLKSYYKWPFSNELAIGSFAIGTLLLLLFKSNTQVGIVLQIGFYYLLFSILINAAMLFYLIFLCIILPNERENPAIKIILLLCNIPIAIRYYTIIF